MINSADSEEVMRQRMTEVYDSAEIERRENQRREQMQREKLLEEQRQAERALEKIQFDTARSNEDRNRQEQKKLDELMKSKNDEFDEIRRNEKRVQQ